MGHVPTRAEAVDDALAPAELVGARRVAPRRGGAAAVGDGDDQVRWREAERDGKWSAAVKHCVRYELADDEKAVFERLLNTVRSEQRPSLGARNARVAGFALKREGEAGVQGQPPIRKSGRHTVPAQPLTNRSPAAAFPKPGGRLSYLPFQTGGRFSANAVAPSRASSDANTGGRSSPCLAQASSSVQSDEALRTISLVVATASGPFDATTAASSSAT